MSNLLFICSKNQWRSPTAVSLFKNSDLHTARSAGTSSKAFIKINLQLINWADVIFVMERKHKDILKNNFPFAIAGKQMVVLEIEDNYHFGDPELLEYLKTALNEYL